MGVIALLLGFAIGPEYWRIRTRATIAPLAASYGIAAMLVAPYWYYLFAYGMPKGSIISPSGVSIDLLNFLIPTRGRSFRRVPDFQRDIIAFHFSPRKRWMDCMAADRDRRALRARAMAQAAGKGSRRDAGAARDRNAGSALALAATP